MKFDFLVGDWACQVWSGVFEEQWSRVDSNLLRGTGLHLVGHQVKFREEMCIEPAGQGFVMQISLGAAEGALKLPVPFRATSYDDSSAQFENPDNDFPKIIRYRRLEPHRLHCRIEGGGEPVDFDFVHAMLSKLTGD